MANLKPMAHDWVDVPIENKKSKQVKPKADDWIDVPLDKPTESPPSDSGDWLSQFGDATLENLPGLGAMAGGILGTTPPGALLGGPLGGAALGGYLGAAGKNAYNRFVNPEKAPKTESEYLTDPLGAGLTGATGEAVGQKIIGPAIGLGLKHAPKVLAPAKWVGKKLLGALGPTDDAIAARAAGKAQPTAKSYAELAEQMADDVNKVGSQISQLDTFAWDTLSNKPDIPRKIITNKINKIISSLRVNGKFVGKNDKRTADVLSDLSEDFISTGEVLSEKNVKAIIKKLDDNIDWGDQTRNVLNNHLKSVREELDEYLKRKNSDYAEAMIPVARRVNLLDKMRRLFNLKNEPGTGLQPTDTTATKIQTSLRENKRVTNNELKKLEAYTENNYQDLAKDYQHAKQFKDQKGERSSARTNLGAAMGTGIGTMAGLIGSHSPLGSAAGGVIGGSLGAPIGKLADRYGGVWAGKIIDTFVKAKQWSRFGSYGPIIQKAAEYSPQMLQSTLERLSKDPNFQNTIRQELEKAKSRLKALEE